MNQALGTSGVDSPASEAALLALSGELPETALLQQLCATHAIVVAADGAAVDLAARGLTPEVVIGDLDSIGGLRATLEESGATVVEESSQETNDFEKALLWIAEAGYRRVTIVGIDGGMLDHTLNNFSVLARHASRLELSIRSGTAIARAIAGRLELASAPGERVSLIPLPSARLSTRGLAWELADETLAIGAREGASNRALGTTVAIDVHEGILLVVHWPAGAAQ